MGQAPIVVASTTACQIEVLKRELFQVQQSSVCDVTAAIQIEVLEREVLEVHQSTVRDVTTMA